MLQILAFLTKCLHGTDTKKLQGAHTNIRHSNNFDGACSTAEAAEKSSTENFAAM